MDGKSIVKYIEEKLKETKTPKMKFYRETGISAATFSQWKNGIYVPSSEALQKIEDYFGVSLGYFEKETAPAEPELSEDEAMLLAAYRALPDDEKRSVLLLLRRAAWPDPGDPGAV